MLEEIKNRTVALAGVCQAAYFANELASTGRVRDEAGLNASLNSLYIIDCDEVSEIYGNEISSLTTGLKSLTYSFNRDPDYISILKYSLTLLTLERKLIKNSQYMEKIQKDILDSRLFQTEEEAFPTQVISKLAQSYSATVSLLQPRIILNGRPEFLKQSQITEKIRAVLLAGIRSSVLWSQMGGSQWQLLFKRGQFVEAAKQLRKGF